MNRRGFLVRLFGGALVLLGIGTVKAVEPRNKFLRYERSSSSYDFGEDGKREFVQEGRLKVSPTFYDDEGATGGRDLTRIQLVVREQIFPIPDGFRRLSSHYTVNFDGTEISWEIIDQEVV